MLKRLHPFGLSAVLALSVMSGALAQGVTQAFTYQGFLRQSGAPVNGNQQMRFRIYNAPTTGTLLWDSGTLPVNVNNGLFTVQLNIPASVWTGAERFLEIQVGATTLSPHVRLNPTPSANTATQVSMFQSGVSNPNRMVITHSPSYTDWGLQYQDVEDKFNFLSGGTPVMTVDLGMQRVGIGTSSPNSPLHVETSAGGRAIYGLNTAASGDTYGVFGRSFSTAGKGVYGVASATTGAAWGVWGETASNTSDAYGVIGQERPGSAGHALYAVGSVAASIKSFQIDHPLMPETHYLNHFCFEGPEQQNIYNGVVVLDARGEAWVQLPAYFEAINRDLRYTLTPIGAAMPNLHVAVEVQGNRFKIAGGVPNRKVSWEVKAIRNDLYVHHYGFQTDQEKEDEIKGKYLYPELYGQPKERGIHYRPELERPQEVEKPRE